MTKNAKIVLWIIVIIIVVLLGWWYFSAAKAVSAPGNGVNSAPLSDQTSASMDAMSSSSASDVPVQGLTTSPSDSSNAALDEDMSNIDTQQGGLNGDSSNVNQSVGAN